MQTHYANANEVKLLGPGWSARICMVRFSALPEVVQPQRFLLIHGNPSNIGDWSHTIPALRTLGEVVAFDQAGFGRSPCLDGAEPTLATYADLAVLLADQLGWDRFVVIGQSHGALVAHTVAARHPQRTQAVVLLCSPGARAHFAYRLLGRPWARRVLKQLGRPVLRARSTQALATLLTDLLVQKVYAPDPAPEGIAAEQLQLFRSNPDAIESVAAVAQEDPCGAAGRHAARINAPVLFVHGKDDQLVPIHYARRLYEKTRDTPGGATFREVPGGHMVHYCRPDVVNAVLVDWLRKVP